MVGMEEWLYQDLDGNFSLVKRKSSSASHDMWQRRRAFVMESFCFNYSDIRSDLHGVP